jgi:hypothetical protein
LHTLPISDFVDRVEREFSGAAGFGMAGKPIFRAASNLGAENEAADPLGPAASSWR